MVESTKCLFVKYLKKTSGVDFIIYLHVENAPGIQLNIDIYLNLGVVNCISFNSAFFH